jgi:hypothetical protein
MGLPEGMKRASVDSSMMVSVGYGPSQRTLEIEFRSGDVYRYLDVPPGVFRDLLAARSKGRFFQANIDGAYAFERVRAARSGRRVRRIPVASSMMVEVGYDAAQRILEIEFRTGGVYRYLDVPEQVFRDLLDARSKGRFFQANIEGLYEFDRVAAKERR